ncbi:hypothetical protein QYE76_013149 [Lolium multiflorum]|uniref:Reverse transcriptase Ty1/copia-type domain-containing protein n=1 Tax=Lolium multiflorum TaxID=4521 RepID=A0AAD8X6Y7_LOLMU|nr:hypothetical protein QYE76_013149 [Lolium multiflorum]
MAENAFCEEMSFESCGRKFADKVKDLETIERGQSLTQELNASKEELEVAHASLTRDLDHLERANKLVKDELKKLGDSHELLQETYKKALGSINDSIVDKNVASSSTSFTSEHAKLVEEHVEEELAKFTTTKNKMGLDDLLSKQGQTIKAWTWVCSQALQEEQLQEGARSRKNKKGYSSTGGPKWVFDSGCTNHMTGGRGVLDQFIEDINKKSSITFGDNSKGKVLGYGKVAISKDLCLETVMLVESLGYNLLSIYHLADAAISLTVHYSNRSSYALHNKTTYELLTGNKPNVMYIRVFGCKCLIKNNKGKLGKFETRTIEGTFVGYAENSHAYRYYNKFTGAIEVSCDVVFLEDNGSQVEQVVPCVASNDDDPSSAIKLMGIGHIRPVEVHDDDQDDGIEMSHIPKNKKKALNPLSKTMMMIKKHPELMFKLKLSLMINFEPLKVHEALVDPDWVIAMQKELECFTRNEVWSLVERPKDHRINVIGTKWVFKNKQDENGIVIRNKARKFEMSMMGELKFFLGFQVRQLAQGTFISQEKYVNDMLKKFNMTNASPMNTPMPVKGQLGSCDGEKHVDIKANLTIRQNPAPGPVNRLLNRPVRRVALSTGWETGQPGLSSGDSSDLGRGTSPKRPRHERPPECRTSSRIPPKAPQHTGPGSSTGQVKKVAQKKKDKHAADRDDLVERVPQFNVGTTHRGDWRSVREENLYHFEERTYTGGDRFFWTKTQASIWEDFYNTRECMKNGAILMPKAINKEELALHEFTKYLFVVDTLKNMGLYDLVCLKPDDAESEGRYCPLLVRQFHCTVFFHNDYERTMTWMTGKEKYSCTYSQFLRPWVLVVAVLVGSRFILRISSLKIFRENLISKSGDTGECRNYHLNLMYYCRPENIRAIDGCDLIYCELRRSVLGRMTPNYAQYVQRLINKVVPSPHNKQDQMIKMEPFKIPTQDNRPEIPSMLSSEHRSKEQHDPAASSSYSRRPKRGAYRYLASLWQMCKNTNDVAHQSLALNQETRRRQNEFMAARNTPVPPSGPEMEPVVAPAWEMPPICDEMFQNFDLSMYAHGGLPPRSARAPADADDDDEEDEGDEDDDGEDDDDDGDGSSPATGNEFY